MSSLLSITMADKNDDKKKVTLVDRFSVDVDEVVPLLMPGTPSYDLGLIVKSTLPKIPVPSISRLRVNGTEFFAPDSGSKSYMANLTARIEELEMIAKIDDKRIQIAAHSDDLEDTNLTLRQKVIAQATFIADQIGAGYARIAVDKELEGSKELNIVLERDKSGALKIIDNGFDKLLGQYPWLTTETDRDQVFVFSAPHGDEYLNGLGVTASIKPQIKTEDEEAKSLGHITFLNIDPKNGKASTEIVSKWGVKFLDTLVAKALGIKNTGEITATDYNSLTDSDRNRIHQEIMATTQLYVEQMKTDSEKPKTEVLEEAVLVDEEGKGYCEGSRFHTNKRKYELNFEGIVKSLEKTGLGNLQEIFKEGDVKGHAANDYNLVRQISMTLDAVFDSIEVGESVVGKVLFPSGDSKKMIGVAARVVGALCLLPKYTSEGFEESDQHDYSAITSKLSQLLVKAGTQGIPFMTLQDETNNSFIEKRRKMLFANETLKDYIELFARNIDHIPGNNAIADIIEATIIAVDEMLKTNYSGPSTVENALNKLHKTGYGLYHDLLAGVLSAPEDYTKIDPAEFS